MRRWKNHERRPERYPRRQPSAHAYAAAGVEDRAGFDEKYDLHRLRIPKESYSFKVMAASPGRVMGRDGLTYLARKAMSDVKRLRFTTTDYFWGMVDGGHMTEANLAHILRHMPFGVHEIMMHPGRSTAVLSQSFSWGYHWEEEFHALISPRIRQLMKEQNIEPIHYGQLP